MMLGVDEKEEIAIDKQSKQRQNKLLFVFK
jgi:hypothetical protein